jgi:subtilisin family serine protease
LERSFVRRAVLTCLFALSPLAAFAAELAGSFSLPLDGQVMSTQCEESEVALDSQHSVSRLGRCSDTVHSDLLWHLDRLDSMAGDLDGRFDRRNRGAGSVVYIMDTGVLATHDELVGAGGSRVVAGIDVTSGVPFGASACHSANKALAPCWSDWSELLAASHGTAVASIVAGRYVGVAPEASVVSIRVMNERGLATTRTYLDGLEAIIHHAWSAGAPPFSTAVVNISGWVLDHLSGMSSDPTASVPYSTVEKKMLDMIAGVDAQGVRNPVGKRFLFVVAGNNVDGGCGRAGVVDRFPAILGREVEGIITVGGMTQTNDTWSGSCSGGLEVLAPAQAIFSATITNHDEYRGKKMRSGTSFATPIISGIAAILLAERPSLSPQELEAAITATPSRTVRPDDRFAGGKVAYLPAPRPFHLASQVAGLSAE